MLIKSIKVFFVLVNWHQKFLYNFLICFSPWSMDAICLSLVCTQRQKFMLWTDLWNFINNMTRIYNNWAINNNIIARSQNNWEISNCQFQILYNTTLSRQPSNISTNLITNMIIRHKMLMNLASSIKWQSSQCRNLYAQVLTNPCLSTQGKQIRNSQCRLYWGHIILNHNILQFTGISWKFDWLFYWR